MMIDSVILLGRVGLEYNLGIVCACFIGSNGRLHSNGELDGIIDGGKGKDGRRMIPICDGSVRIGLVINHICDGTKDGPNIIEEGF